MRTIDRTNQFKRDYKRELKGQHRATLNEDFSEVVKLLVNDLHLPKQYRDHALTGEWQTFRDCHIKPDLVLIYQNRTARFCSWCASARIANPDCRPRRAPGCRSPHHLARSCRTSSAVSPKLRPANRIRLSQAGGQSCFPLDNAAHLLLHAAVVGRRHCLQRFINIIRQIANTQCFHNDLHTINLWSLIMTANCLLDECRLVFERALWEGVIPAR